MTGERVTQMDTPDIADFLAAQQAGVLSMADDDAGYGIPVSFTFDDEDHEIFFRMGYGPKSQKRRFVESSNTVSFVVVDETDEGWKSVIARGRLEVLSDSNIDSAIVEAVRHLDIPYFQVHNQPASDMTFTIVRLDVTELSGIVEG
jgi:hypothetical protein